MLEKQQIKVETVAQSKPVKRKLSYKESRELESLPNEIDTLETEISTIQEQINQPDFFNQDESGSSKILNQLQELESKLEACYSRWQELDET
mgnify:CR=1 FL=1